MSTNWGDNSQGAELVTLSDFASQLENHIAVVDTKDNAKKDVDIREEAEILLSLLSAKPPSHSPFMDEDDYTSSSDFQELIRRDPSFSFTIPIMSLEPNCSQQCGNDASKSPSQESSQGSTTSEDSFSSVGATSAPAQLLSRHLVADGSSVEVENCGETMARNIAKSFHKAVEWRIQSWIHSLSSILVKREQALTEAHASDDIIRELLDTAEAQVLLCLQKAASDIQVLDTKTCLRVLPQRINRSQDQNGLSCPPLCKKRKMENVTASLQTESEYKYAVAHGLSFESTMNLKTPAGYTEVTIEAPGIIEGRFRSSDLGEDTLTGISVEVDTNVLAMAIERSSRVVARTATHAIIPTTEEESEDEEEETVSKEQTEEFASPTLDGQTGTLDSEATKAVLVTPSKTTSSLPYQVTDDSPMFPERLDNVAKDMVRMVSPPARSPEYLSFNFTPRTPEPTTDKTAGLLLNLVSPPPAPAVSPPTPSSASSSKPSSEDEGSPTISARKSPSLSGLLQVASEAMKAC